MTNRRKNPTSTLTAMCLAALMSVGPTATAPAWATYGHYGNSIELSVLGTYETGIFDDSAAEIPAYDKRSQRVFVTNSAENSIDVLDVSYPPDPVLDFKIDLSPYGDGPNSVAVNRRGVVAVAVANETATDPGVVVFFDRHGTYLNQLTVGSLPDMLTFSPNEKWLLVANEAEPNDDYTVDPEGSISVIRIGNGSIHKIKNLSQADVRTADFQAYNFDSIDPNVRIFGPNATVAQDLEPEYIAVAPDSKTAFVALQENNALAIVDIKDAKVEAVVGLGLKDHRLSPLDPSNRDDAINIQTWPIFGMYQPDAIAAYKALGHTFIVSVNEGDSRDYDGFSEEDRVKDLTLDPFGFPNAASLQEDENLGRIKITNTIGDVDNDGDFDKLYAYGARSFSIWSTDGKLIYDSGSDFEDITAEMIPDNFNSTNDENGSFDNRSDDKGPEPEALAIGKIRGRNYAFIGLERVGGIMVYDITDPFDVEFVQYLNNRDFDGDAEAGTAGDLGPEGIVFIPRSASPIHKPMLAVTNEVSGTTTLYKISITH